MWVAVITITGIALVAGILLSAVSQRLPADRDKLASKINELLPQTQCAQCGYAGCRPYAEAIAHRSAAINLCPPGGEDTVRRLASLLGREVLPLEAAGGPRAGEAVAIIDEPLCIGCTFCREACPVDAIVGAQQLMHTVLAAECTGCELCLPPCPVDCIKMRPAA